MEKGSAVLTPQFLHVEIVTILTKEEAKIQGFIIPTGYDINPAYDVLGKSVGKDNAPKYNESGNLINDYRLEFAAVICSVA